MMSSPFLGMDPFIEANHLWHDFHHDLATEIKKPLNSQIAPKYYATVETYSLMEQIDVALPRQAIYPDVSVFTPQPTREPVMTSPQTLIAPIERLILATSVRVHAVKVYTTELGQLVTSIEILSPVNKQGKGLDKYIAKRKRLLHSPVHLVEIDLLRGGERPGQEVNHSPIDTDYILLVNRFVGEGQPRKSEIWPVALNETLPLIPIPLLFPDPDVVLDLNQAIHTVYENSNYQYRLDYRQPVPPPKLRPKMARWWRERLKK